MDSRGNHVFLDVVLMVEAIMFFLGYCIDSGGNHVFLDIVLIVEAIMFFLDIALIVGAIMFSWIFC